MSPKFLLLRVITDQVPQSPLVAVWINTREVTTLQRATVACLVAEELRSN